MHLPPVDRDRLAVDVDGQRRQAQSVLGVRGELGVGRWERRYDLVEERLGGHRLDLGPSSGSAIDRRHRLLLPWTLGCRGVERQAHPLVAADRTGCKGPLASGSVAVMSTALSDRLLEDGFVAVEGALEPSFCELVVADAFDRMGVVENDPTTWPAGVTHLPVVRNWDLDQVAPAAAAVLDELVGGRSAVAFSGVQDNLIVNMPDPDATWRSPTQQARSGRGWHKDGDWFRHFLDSPEQALLGIVFWRDVEPTQGATYVAVDSIAPVAALLARHPEGLDPGQVTANVPSIVANCRNVRVLPGRQGTIVWAHPFLLHTASVNDGGPPRLISNTSVMLRQPMRFGHSALTPVERSIVAALGVDRLDFHPTGRRGRVDSERARRWINDEPLRP